MLTPLLSNKVRLYFIIAKCYLTTVDLSVKVNILPWKNVSALFQLLVDKYLLEGLTFKIHIVKFVYLIFLLKIYSISYFLAIKKHWPIYGRNDLVFIPMTVSCISCFCTKGWALNLTRTSSPTSCTGSSAFTTTSSKPRFCRRKIFSFKLKIIQNSLKQNQVQSQ
jgi:hypothetical protein